MKLILTLLVLISLTAFAAPRSIELAGPNSLFFGEEIDASTVDMAVAAMLGKRIPLPEAEPLYVVLASPGGRYDAGKYFSAVLNKLPNTYVICKACMSDAAFIFATAPSPKRLAIRKSLLLMHEMYLEKVTAEQVKERRLLSILTQQSYEFNLGMESVLHMTDADYVNKIKDKEWTVQGEELVKLHLADELVTVTCTPYVKSMAPDTCSQTETDSK